VTTAQWKIGIVGCGLIGHRRALHLPASFELAAVFDPSVEAMERLTTGASATPRMASSAEEIVLDDHIDVVLIATPHNQLSPLTVASLERGKHCFVEKPGGASKDDIARIGAAADASGSIVRFGFNHRFHPSILSARNLIASGIYGDVASIRAVYGHGGRLGYETEWRARREIAGGGELVDQGSHLIDLIGFLAGIKQLEFVHLPTSFWKMEVEDNAFLALSLKQGGLAWLHTSWTEWKNTFRMEIALRKARIDIIGLGKSYGIETLVVHEMDETMQPPSTTSTIFESPDDSWATELSHFERALRGEPNLGATCNDVLGTWSIIEQAYSR